METKAEARGELRGETRAESRTEARPEARLTDPRLSAPRAVDLRRGRAPEVEIIACPTYDFLLSVHVSLATPDNTYADYDVGREWIEAARARCAARDPRALATLGRYLGDGRPGSLHATLISLVWQCPAPRDPRHFLDWLTTLPAAQLAEALLDQEGLSADWPPTLLAALAEHEDRRSHERRREGQAPHERKPDRKPDPKATLATIEPTSATARLLDFYVADVRPTVLAILDGIEGARAELITALAVWNEAVFEVESPRIEPLLAREAQALERRRAEMAPEPFIELAMRGVQWQRPAGLRRIIFAPSYFCRPAVFYHFWHGALTFCAPIEFSPSETEAPWRDPRAPGDDILRFFEALGDSTRLRILRLLADREMYLTELAERLGLTKATTKHHMVRLRAAGFVTLYDRDRLTYYALRPDVARRAGQMLDAYLGHASQSAAITPLPPLRAPDPDDAHAPV